MFLRSAFAQHQGDALLGGGDSVPLAAAAQCLAVTRGCPRFHFCTTAWFSQTFLLPHTSPFSADLRLHRWRDVSVFEGVSEPFFSWQFPSSSNLHLYSSGSVCGVICCLSEGWKGTWILKRILKVGSLVVLQGTLWIPSAIGGVDSKWYQIT